MFIAPALLFLAGLNVPQSADLPVWHFMDQATTPAPRAGMPAYAALLYRDTVNLAAVEAAWERYYEDLEPNAAFEDLERNPFAKYVHRWLGEASAFADADGVVRALSTEQLLSYRRAVPKDTLASAALGARDSSGGTPSWTFVGPKETFWAPSEPGDRRTAPWQVNIYCIAAAPSEPATLYCGSETGALYKTVDRGLVWTPVDSMNWGRGILSIAIHPTTPETVYCATGTDIFKSSDGGVSWAIVLTESGLSCNSLAFDPQEPETVYAGTASGLYVTRDGGDSWTLPLTELVDDVEVRPGDGSTVYVNTRSGSPERWTFYRSLDRGVSFQESMDGWGSQLERSGSRIAVTPADPDVVFALLLGRDEDTQEDRPVLLRSGDRGATWATVATGRTAAFPLNNGQGYYDLDLMVSAGDADHLIAGTQTSYKSVDGGVTWTALGGYSGPFNIHPDIQATISVPRAGGIDTWITTDGGVNYSTDFFTDVSNWTARIVGLDGTNFWGYGQGWNEDYGVGGRYHNGNTALAATYPAGEALRLGGAESPTGWALHGRERHAAFDDISNLIIPSEIDQPIEGTFPFTKHPNIHYYGDAFSRVMVDLGDYKTIYTGRDESFWRSTDGGIQWEATHTFDGRPFHFDISRADPYRIYLAATNGFHVSLDRGMTFVERSLPAGLSDWHSQNLRVAASSTDPDLVWVLNQRSGATLTQGRIFESTDGGQTWTDLTTPALAGRRWTSMAHQVGTNGGLYIASSRGPAGSHPARVLYRDRSMSDWVDYSAGLPPSASPIKLLPFYRGNKLRWIGNRGVWEIDLFETDWAPKAQPFVGGARVLCVKDTVELDSYSVARADAAYRWTVPGASWTSALDQREVQARFPSAGLYSATLEVEQDGQVSVGSVTISVDSACVAEPLRGRALGLSGQSGDYATASRPLELSTNEVTIMGWVKRDGAQAQWAGIFFERSSLATGLNMRTGTNLGFHWRNGSYGWDSGHTLPNERWAHVALVASPNGVTIYMNGLPSTRSFNVEPYEFSGLLALGADLTSSSRRFRGEIDEVLVFDRALGREEVLERMHLTRTVESEADLAAYWQFNREAGPIPDRVGSNHMGLVGAAETVVSTAPVGPGVSASASVAGAGAYSFGETGLTLTFGGQGTSYPTGNLWITRVDDLPDTSPGAATLAGQVHWFIRHSDPSDPFQELDFATLRGPWVGTPSGRLPSNYRLYRRGLNSDGETWGPAKQTATGLMGGPSPAVHFTRGPWQVGQWALTFDPTSDAGVPVSATPSGG